MGKKGIEDMISEIEIFVDSCKFQPLSSTKIVIPKEEMMSMLKELRVKMPSEIERCQKIMRNKDAIMADARSQAEQVVADATNEAFSLVDQHEIVELAQVNAQEIINQAQTTAQEMLESAKRDADDIRLGAMHYTRNTLMEVEEFIQSTLMEESAKFTNLIEVLQSNANVVASNRQEIEEQINGAVEQEYTPSSRHLKPEHYDEDEYDYDE